MVEHVAGMTIGDFVRLYEDEGPFELIDGERIHLSPPLMKHVKTTHNLLFDLHLHVKKHHLGEVFSETPFVVAHTSNWVRGSRVPDLLFVAAERFADYQTQVPDWQDKPLVLVPDLVAEIVSANDRYTEIAEKVRRYLEDGVQVIWLVDPFERIVIVYTAGSNQQTRLTEGDALDGGSVIPGFSMPVAALFA